MNTDQLITLLAKNAGPVPQGAIIRSLMLAVLGGLLCTTVFTVLAFGMQTPAFFATTTPWIKLLYTIPMVIAATWLASRLARPLARHLYPQLVVLGLLLAMATFSVASLTQVVPPETPILPIEAHSWLLCAGQTLILSLPALIIIFGFMRKMAAPSNLRAAGAAAGLLAGAIASSAYTLSCSISAENAVLWYTLAMTFSSLLGLWFGPKVLRW